MAPEHPGTPHRRQRGGAGGSIARRHSSHTTWPSFVRSGRAHTAQSSGKTTSSTRPSQRRTLGPCRAGVIPQSLTLQYRRISLRVAFVALTEQALTDDLARAMKAREMPRVYVLRGVLTAVKNLRVENR